MHIKIHIISCIEVLLKSRLLDRSGLETNYIVEVVIKRRKHEKDLQGVPKKRPLSREQGIEGRDN